MSEEIKKFTNKLRNNDSFKAKVAIWHILIAKVFLDIYFEKYYINFVNDGEFDQDAFLKSVWYIDIMLNWDNYTDRYASFEDIQDNIVELLTKNEKIPLTLRQSIISDLDNIIWKKDDYWNDIIAPYSLDFEKNKNINQKVKESIENFLEKELNNLKKVLAKIEIKDVKSWFLLKIKEILN